MSTRTADRGTVVGILHPGDLGTAIASALIEAGTTVVVAPGGRGPVTRRRAEAAGAERVGSVAEVVDRSSVLLSVVPPDAALEIAGQIRDAVDAGASAPLVVDVNSISPKQQQRVAARLAAGGVDCVDAGLQGTAGRLRDACSLFLSGPRAADAARVLGPVGRVRVVGSRIGAASEQKMLLSALSKGLAMLMLETLLAAERCGALDESIEAVRFHYPEIWDTVSRTLPTYGAHSARRVDEMEQITAHMGERGISMPMTAAATATVSAVADLSRLEDERPPHVASVVRGISATPVLVAEQRAAQEG